jgi:hypothetical protein
MEERMCVVSGRRMRGDEEEKGEEEKELLVSRFRSHL